MTYAAQLRVHLARSLARRVPFERAWTDATSAHRPPTGWPMDDTRAAFRAAYTGHGQGSLGILADREPEAPVTFPDAGEPAGPTPRRCGSSLRCIAPVAPDRVRFVVKSKKRARVTVIVPEVGPSYLCPTHQAEILAAITRAEYRDRGEVAHDMDLTGAVAA